MPTDVAEKLTALERENRELRRANEVLRNASAYSLRRSSIASSSDGRLPVIPQEQFRFEADRAHSTVIELNSSHAIPVTFPHVVVDVIKQAAQVVAS